MNLQRIIGKRLFEAFANWAIRRALRTPYTHLRQPTGEGYMDRYWGDRVGRSGAPEDGYPWIGDRIHHILSSDDDRAMHDHPWPFVTIILRGGYEEIRPFDQDKRALACEFVDVGGQRMAVTRRRYKVGDVLFRRARHWHMLHLEPGETAVTLFIVLPKVQSWGFLWRGRKVPWREFERVRGARGVYSTEQPYADLRRELPEYRDAA